MEKLDNYDLRLRHLVVLCLIITLVWAISGYWVSSLQNPGPFGDMFGAVNALFSGLAFAGVIFAILLQRKELALQRHELELTRQELEGQKLQLRAQNETMKRQTFENTFFQLLNLHNEIVGNQHVVVTAHVEARGRDTFRHFFNFLVLRHRQAPPETAPYAPHSQIDLAYSEFYKDNQATIGQYLANLYQILKFVKEGEIEPKRRYTDLVKAQLSTYERVLLFYHCLSHLGRDDFKPLTQEFDFFAGLNPDLLINPTHASLY